MSTRVLSQDQSGGDVQVIATYDPSGVVLIINHPHLGKQRLSITNEEAFDLGQALVNLSEEGEM